MSEQIYFSFSEAFPALAVEFTDLLLKEGLVELANEVQTLKVYDRCRCGEKRCATFYFAPKPEGAWGNNLETVQLESESEMDFIVDYMGEKILDLELLGNPVISSKLASLCP